MKVIVFNNLHSLLVGTTQSIGIRMSYLLADKVAAAGTFLTDILFDDIPPPPSYVQKAKMIELFCEKTDDPIPETQQIIQLLKSLAKIKHKNKQQIMLEKQMQKNIDNLYNAIVAEMREKTMQSGLIALKDLMDGKMFGMYNMNQADIECSEKSCVPSSDILSLQLPDPEEGPEFFYLSAEFFGLALVNKDKMFSLTDKEAAKADKKWLHKCFTLPNINLFTPLELKAARKQLEQPGGEFRKQCDAWVKTSKECSAAESVEYFKKHVLGHAASFQAAISQNELIKHCYASQRIEATVEVMVGEIPFIELWEYYKAAGVIHEPTWEKLIALKEKDPRFNGRVAVIGLLLEGADKDFKEEEKNREKAAAEPEIQSVKKSISVD